MDDIKHAVTCASDYVTDSWPHICVAVISS